MKSKKKTRCREHSLISQFQSISQLQPCGETFISIAFIAVTHECKRCKRIQQTFQLSVWAKVMGVTYPVAIFWCISGRLHPPLVCMLIPSVQNCTSAICIQTAPKSIQFWKLEKAYSAFSAFGLVCTVMKQTPVWTEDLCQVLLVFFCQKNACICCVSCERFCCASDFIHKLLALAPGKFFSKLKALHLFPASNSRPFLSKWPNFEWPMRDPKAWAKSLRDISNGFLVPRMKCSNARLKQSFFGCSRKFISHRPRRSIKLKASETSRSSQQVKSRSKMTFFRTQFTSGKHFITFSTGVALDVRSGGCLFQVLRNEAASTSTGWSCSIWTFDLTHRFFSCLKLAGNIRPEGEGFTIHGPCGAGTITWRSPSSENDDQRCQQTQPPHFSCDSTMRTCRLKTASGSVTPSPRQRTTVFHLTLAPKKGDLSERRTWIHLSRSRTSSFLVWQRFSEDNSRGFRCNWWKFHAPLLPLFASRRQEMTAPLRMWQKHTTLFWGTELCQQPGTRTKKRKKGERFFQVQNYSQPVRPERLPLFLEFEMLGERETTVVTVNKLSNSEAVGQEKNCLRQEEHVSSKHFWLHKTWTPSGLQENYFAHFPG